MNIFFHLIYICIFVFTASINLSQDLKSPSFPDSVLSVNLVVVGDLMCHTKQFDYARISKDSFDFKPVFAWVKPIIENADFAIGNLETTIAGEKKGYSGYPLFNTPDEYLDALRFAGFDLLITANNHALDSGKEGALRTIEKIEEFGMFYNGTNISKDDQDSVRIYDIKGLKVALFSYTGFSNRHVKVNGNYTLINYIDTLQIKRNILRADSLNPDLVIVYFHFGDEYSKEPSFYQEEIVKKTILYGADVIIASHPHVLQPIELFKSNSGRIDSGFVAYSLGNFISNQRWRYSDCGVILNFSINQTVDQNIITLGEILYTPTWVFKGNTGSRNEYIILPIYESDKDTSLTFIKKNDLEKMNESFTDTEEILTKRSNRPKRVMLYNQFNVIRDSTGSKDF